MLRTYTVAFYKRWYKPAISALSPDCKVLYNTDPISFMANDIGSDKFQLLRRNVQHSDYGYKVSSDVECENERRGENSANKYIQSEQPRAATCSQAADADNHLD